MGVDVLDEFAARHDAILMVHQVRQHPKLVARQLDRLVLECHPAVAWVQGHRAGDEQRLRVAAGAPDQRPKPCQYFLDAERLCHVVVGAAVDALHLLVPAAARGQHQDGGRNVRRAPRSQQRQAVDVRQAQVEHNRVVRLGAHEEVGAFAVGGGVGGVARSVKRVRQLP